MMTPTETKPTLLRTVADRRQREKLLAQLIYETDATGKPVYYRGYREVLNGTKIPEEIMGASGLQSFLVDLIVNFLHLHPHARQYKYLYNEFGVQIARKKWRSCGIAIYHRERLKGFVYTNKYVGVPPDYVIEIDTKADLSKYKNQQAYFIEKTQQLHEFGVKKVIWIFTENLQVIWVSNAGESITIHPSWDVDLTVTEGVTFNLARLIEAEEATLL